MSQLMVSGGWPAVPTRGAAGRHCQRGQCHSADQSEAGSLQCRTNPSQTRRSGANKPPIKQSQRQAAPLENVSGELSVKVVIRLRMGYALAGRFDLNRQIKMVDQLHQLFKQPTIVRTFRLENPRLLSTHCVCFQRCRVRAR